MVHFILCATLCGSLLGTIAAQTTGVGGVSTTTAMSAHGNMLAIADSTITTTAQATGHVGINYFDYRTNSWTGREDILFNPFTIETGPPSLVTFGDAGTTVNGNNGFGHDVTCANDDTIFISACNKNFNSGRVYMYKGRNAHWTAQQILNSYRSNPHEYTSTSKDTFFGEAIDSTESMLAVGCRNCNSTEHGYEQSGEVYIFRPEEDKSSMLWTNTQVLIGEDTYFMGGHVAMHDNVLVSSGSAKEDFTLNTIATKPIQASIFMSEDHLAPHGPKSEFKFQHNIFTRDPVYQSIADVAVYDMTIAMATYDTVRDVNTLYIFYPNTKQYNLESKDAKGKPRALSWSLVQVMVTPDPTNMVAQNPTSLTLWDNKLYMRAREPGFYYTLASSRTTRGGTYSVFDESLPTNEGTGGNHLLTTSDFKLFEDGLVAGRVLNSVTDLTRGDFQCLRIWAMDEFDDGWDVAELIVESPSGVKRSFKTDCDSTNPLVHRYCPVYNEEKLSGGIHKIYVINAHEAKFNWEIMFKVYDESTAQWYFGDIHTELDFEWRYRDTAFAMTRSHLLSPSNETCTQCPRNADEWETYQKSLLPSKPKAKPQRRLQNLRSLSRSLHSRSDTAAPSISPAPTIAVDFNQNWNMLEMVNDAGNGVILPWFSGDGTGTSFYISDTEGKKLVYSGSSCVAGNVAMSCYVKLDDGDYVLRVTGANDAHTLERRWKFCQGLNYQKSQTELYFSIVDGLCFPVMTRHQTSVCDNVLKVTNLVVGIVLSGDFSSMVGYDAVGAPKTVSSNQLQPVAVAVSHALQHIFAFEEVSSNVVEIQGASVSSITVLVDVGFKHLDQSTYSTLEGLMEGSGTSSKNTIIDYVLSAPASIGIDHSVMGAVTGVAVSTMSLGDETVDFALVDESNFREVTDFIPATSETQAPSNAMLVKSERLVAMAGYLIALATIFVAIGFVYSTIRDHVSPAAVEKAPIRPSAARASLHLNDSDESDSDSSDGVDEENSTPRFLSSRSSVKDVSKKTKKSSDLKLKKLLKSEDAVYRKGSRPTGLR